jgi:riboflavin kinase/FMN adenylyltransferase
MPGSPERYLLHPDLILAKNLMQYYQNLTDVQLENSLVTIGSFDGVHVGHQQIIRDLVERSRQVGIPAAVITFHPHPQLVITEDSRPFYLTMPEERAHLLGKMGVDLVLIYPFDREVSQMTAKRFISGLYERFHFSDLWVGYDFALGKEREGTPERLQELGQEFGFSVHKIPAYEYEGELISSSSIRKKIRNGEVKAAAKLLGRPFDISGDVIKGENRGKSLGFATSNLSVPPELIDIRPGVYACKAELHGEVFNAVTNIGFRPTFGGGIDTPRIEAHLLDFSRDLYGQHLKLIFIDRLRDEIKFEKVSDLVYQIQSDVKTARQILEN